MVGIILTQLGLDWRKLKRIFYQKKKSGYFGFRLAKEKADILSKEFDYIVYNTRQDPNGTMMMDEIWSELQKKKDKDGFVKIKWTDNNFIKNPHGKFTRALTFESMCQSGVFFFSCQTNFLPTTRTLAL